MNERAKELRANATDAERLLWLHLRARRMCGFKFRRQMPIGRHIVDFACIEAKLVVEADGGQHLDRACEDQRRSRSLAAHGYKVIRFWNHDILLRTEAVLESIRRHLLQAPLQRRFGKKRCKTSGPHES